MDSGAVQRQRSRKCERPDVLDERDRVDVLPAGWHSVPRERRHAHRVREEHGEADRLGDERLQYEIGFVSLGLGVAGLVATGLNRGAWLVLTIVITFFLILAAAQHIKAMVQEKNFKPGNSVILLYDIGLPISLWICLANIPS